MPYCRGSTPDRRWPPNMLSNFTYGCFQGFQIPKYSNAYSLQQRLIRISSSGVLEAGNSCDARICLSVFGNLGISTFSNLELRKCANFGIWRFWIRGIWNPENINHVGRFLISRKSKLLILWGLLFIMSSMDRRHRKILMFRQLSLVGHVSIFIWWFCTARATSRPYVRVIVIQSQWAEHRMMTLRHGM